MQSRGRKYLEKDRCQLGLKNGEGALGTDCPVRENSRRTDWLTQKLRLSQRKHWTIASGQAIFPFRAENRIRDEWLKKDK
jgi:hypothetical protein